MTNNKKWSDERKAAKIAADAADKARWESQTIRIDENWKIIRADELNWQIVYKGKERGYYGKLSHAFLALVDKMLGEEAKGSLATCTDIIRAIQVKIEEALKGR